jgi:hypothetical protein
MPVVTEPLTETEAKRESVILSLEPRPIAVATATPTIPEKSVVPIPPDPEELEVATEEPTLKKKKSVKTVKLIKTEPKEEIIVDTKSQFLELGEGFRIAHKPGSAYSVLYKVVAENGHFASTVKTLSAKPDLNDAVVAKKLISKMLVPIDELETMCRAESSWQEHAAHKTEVLKEKEKAGDEQASGVLKDPGRSVRGSWKGNISEMVSTCVGSYAAFTKGTKCNKNVQKFADAKLLFRRFKTTGGSYVMMYPEKFERQIDKAIKKVYSTEKE